MRVFRKVLYVFLTLSILYGCGGGEGEINDTGLITGVVATGSPLKNATVTMKSTNGIKKTVQTNANGEYSISIDEDMESPFILKVDESEGKELFSIAHDEGTTNIHPLSDLVARNSFGSKNKNIEDEIDSTNSFENPPSEEEVKDITRSLTNLLASSFGDFEVKEQFDLLHSEFSANGKEFDKLLDHLTVNIGGDNFSVKLKDPKIGFTADIVLNFSLTESIAIEDTQEPSKPGGLVVLPASSDSIVLAWNSSTDNVGIAGYNIYKSINSQLSFMNTSPFPVFTDTGLTPNSTICYAVEAIDGSGNKSPKTTTSCTTTLSETDNANPGTIQNLLVQAEGASQINLNWSVAPENDVLAYDIFRSENGSESVKIAVSIENRFQDDNLNNSTEYCYTVKAFDASGNRSTESSNEACVATSDNKPIVDVISPDTTITSENESPTRFSSISITFRSSELGSTFECALDQANFGSCESPANYSELSDGNHTFSVRAIDTSGNVDPTPKNFSWEIDTTPPETLIQSKPKNITNATVANFSFTSNETGSSFQCAIDAPDANNPAFEDCTSPIIYSDLVEGVHNIKVRAIDAVGNVDDSPAEFQWEVDLTPPDTVVVNSPDSLTNLTTANFEFSSTEINSIFQCAIDSNVFVSCSNIKTYSDLSEGIRNFSVQAIDEAGNIDQSPAMVSWEIDITPPETSISDGPASPTNTTAAAFSFDSNEAGSTFQCALDAEDFGQCSNPANYTNVSEGDHIFKVNAIDPAGNIDMSPANYEWTVDITPPVVSVPMGITVIILNQIDAPVTLASIQEFLNSATAEDNIDGDVNNKITNDAPAAFPLGINTVTFSVTDVAGNTGTNSSTIEVIDEDLIPPQVTSIVLNRTAEYAVVLNEVSVRLKATDNIGVTGYLITEHNVTDFSNVIPPIQDPLLSGSNWIAIEETTNFDFTVQVPFAQAYKLSDRVQLCAWFRDEQGNISDRICDSIQIGNDWESGIGNWSADNGVWQVGTPTAGPESCFSGTQCAGTVLDGNYGVDTDSRLISPSIELSAVTGTEEIHLRFQNWFSYLGGDSGQFQVSIWDVATSTWSDWSNEGGSVANTSGWSLKDVNLTAYAGEVIRIAFYHTASRPSCCNSSGFESTGWYIDDVSISYF